MSRALTSALFSSSMTPTARQPRSHALCSGVRPSLSCALMSAPLASSVLATSRWPFSDAACSAERPCCARQGGSGHARRTSARGPASNGGGWRRGAPGAGLQWGRLNQRTAVSCGVVDLATGRVDGVGRLPPLVGR